MYEAIRIPDALERTSPRHGTPDVLTPPYSIDVRDWVFVE
jgi:hypothetical protein